MDNYIIRTSLRSDSVCSAVQYIGTLFDLDNFAVLLILSCMCTWISIMFYFGRFELDSCVGETYLSSACT
jgi:hypothetical protein